MTSYVITMPWTTGHDERQFRKLLRVTLAITVVSSLVIPFIRLPEISRQAQESLPPQFAEIILKKPTPKPVHEQVQQPEKKTEKKMSSPVARQKKIQHQSVREARQKARSSGILAFKDALADMRQAVDPAALRDTGAVYHGAGKAATIDRAVLASKSGKPRANVNVAALSNKTGGVAMAGRETTRVEAHQEVATGGAANVSGSASDARARSIEDIRRVFDANKGAIFAIYNRALRSDPTLVGKLVLELVIEPDGHVSNCQVISSELENHDLVTKIVHRVQMFDFGEEPVEVTRISYPVHFLPS